MAARASRKARLRAERRSGYRSSIGMAAYSYRDPNAPQNEVIDGAELYFIILFFSEMVCKIIAYGFCMAPSTYPAGLCRRA